MVSDTGWFSTRSNHMASDTGWFSTRSNHMASDTGWLSTRSDGQAQPKAMGRMTADVTSVESVSGKPTRAKSENL